MKRVGVACFVAVLVLCAVGLLIRDHRLDSAAGQSALEQYRQRTGSTDVSVAWTSRYGDCAIVTLHDSRQQGVASIAMKRVGARWSTGRSTEDEEAQFDSDDVGSEGDCLGVADSSGPLVNGGPPE